MSTFGDIVKVELPPPVGPSGHEQFGYRPAIVVQDNIKFRSLPTVIIVPLTANPSASRFLGTFFIKKTPINGLTEDSIAMVFQIRAIDKTRIKATVGRSSPAELQELTKKLKELVPIF